MGEYTDEELMSGYLTNYVTGDESYFWAFESINDLIGSDPERLWRITVKMIKKTTDESALAYIAAGPLEDLLAYHGDVFIERIEMLARQDPHFCVALTSVYGQTRFKREIYLRVQSACKGTPVK
jgi:hypothetical protein